jgi:hypothetical protein
MPGVGGHEIAFFHLGASNATSISTSAMTTQAAGSTIIVGIGRGELDAFKPSAVPTDNKGNAPYQQLGATEKYERWPSGTAVFAFPSARGGANHSVTTQTPSGDEVTLAAVEVLDSTRIQDVQWNQPLEPPLTSNSVTTTGPATLIAMWWGDGFPGTPQNAKPNNDFVLLDSNAKERDSFVQCAVAFKNVTEAGTYDVTWEPDPSQGAQLWLIAVQ